MSNAFGPKSLAVLNHLAKHGDKNRLELERELGMAQLDQNLSHLRRGEHVRSLPKARGELVRYAITTSGRNVIGAHVQRQESLRYRPISEMAPYVPPPDFTARRGAMDAYRLPSRGMQ